MFLFSTGTGALAAGRSFDAELAEADQIRSAQPKEFLELLGQLQKQRKSATRSQEERLRYLEAYALGVYRDKPEDSIRMASALFDQTKDVTLKYRAGSLVANLAGLKRDFSTGLRFLQKTLAIRNKVANKDIRHDGIGAAAVLYNEIGQYQIALNYAREMLADGPGPRTKCAAGYVEIQSQLELHQLPKGDDAVQSVINACSSIHEVIPLNLAKVVLARKWAEEERVPDAVKLLEDALPEIEHTRYPRLIAGVHAFIAEFKLKLGDVESAEKHANMTIALGEQIKSSATLVSAYNTLYQIAARHEKPTMALQLYKHYAESEIARQNDVKARELAYEIVRHETLRQTQQIALQDRAIKILQLQRTLDRESAQKARLAMVFLLLLLAAAVFWAIQVKRHQAQLQRLAQTDGLTGLRNRHFFTQKAERTLVDAARAGETAALVMFDLDHFKAINDTYGHGAGDWVLKQVGKTCAAHCRRIDYLSRIGGEEFAVLLRGFDLAAGARLAEDCRSQLAQIDTRESGYSFVVTASFGVSSTAESGYDLSRLLSHADQMLYRAKNEGRNRVCAYTADTAAERRGAAKRSPTLTVVGG
ncbi:MAG: GGDEF domain-containing protein [Lysobacteraceae bacterium]